MKKENILSKLNYNLKNYSVELEEILERKSYSEEAKNLLLSMFYKIQNFYQDYKDVKIDVEQSREIFIQDLIKTIAEECQEIEVIDPSNKKMIGKFEVDKQRKKVTTFPDEVSLLHAIYELKIKSDTKMMSPITSAVIKTLNEGYGLSASEVIRDFTGWTWNPSVSEDYVCSNLIYTNLLMLMGYDKCSGLLQIEEKNKINSRIRLYIKQIYGEKHALKFTDSLIKICLASQCQKDISLKEKMEKEKNRVMAKYEKMQDKANFLGYVTTEKKELNNQIKDMDRILNDPKLIKEECKKRKTITQSELIDIMQYERLECLKEIKECNKLMDPRQYSRMFEIIKNKYNLYKTFTFLDDKKINVSKYIVEFEKEFLNCFKSKVNSCKSKNELIDIIYEYRYYGYTKYNKDKVIKENRYLSKENRDLLETILLKAEKLKVFETVTNNSEINRNIIQELFNLKMMNLTNAYVEVVKKENNCVINYYDRDTLEMSKETDNKDVKSKKKIKIFM